jgi:hypothetical protein
MGVWVWNVNDAEFILYVHEMVEMIGTNFVCLKDGLYWYKQIMINTLFYGRVHYGCIW